MNVEGGAGGILFPATSEDLAPVVEIDLDHEPGSPYDLGELLGHLAGAGLNEVNSAGEKLYLIRRTVSAPSITSKTTTERRPAS